jgi:hypothetical protein
MGAEELKNFLDKGFPRPQNLTFNNINNIVQFKSAAEVLWGNAKFDRSGLTLEPIAGEQTAKVKFGDVHWKNYSVETTVNLQSGKSVELSAYVPNSHDGLEFGFTNDGYVFLRETVRGKQNELQEPKLVNTRSRNYHTLGLVFKDGVGTAFFDGSPVFGNIHTSYQQGFVAVKVWGENEKAKALFNFLSIRPAQSGNTK